MPVISGVGPQPRIPRIVPTLPASGPIGDFIHVTATDANYIANNAGTYEILDTGTDTGTVASVNVASANGQSGSVADPTGNAVITLNNPSALVCTTSIQAPFFVSAAANPADAGAIRLGNTEVIAWENSTPGTDLTLGVNSSNVLVSSVQISAPTLVSTVATGTAPFTVASTTQVANLNAATAGTASAVAVGGITGLGTAVATALAVNIGTAGAFVVLNGAGGTPSSLVGTNITGTATGLTVGNATLAANLSGTPGLPNGTTATTQSQADNSTKLATTAYVDTGLATKQATITFGTGVQTALGVNIGSAGAPVLFNGAGGTPSSMVGTNITGTASGLTAGTASAVAVGGITGLGTGVATALAINVGTAGSPVVNGGALGSPSSAGTIPAFTLGGTISGGGNQINNVIIGTTTPLAGSFTTVSATSNITAAGSVNNTVSGTGNAAFLLAQNSTDSTFIQIDQRGSAATGTSFGLTRAGMCEFLMNPVAGGVVVFGTFNSTAVVFGTNNTANLTLNPTGNLKMAGTAVRGTTEGTNHLDIFNGTAPAGTLTNGISLYSSGGECFVMDAGGTATQISSHERSTGEWIHHSFSNQKRLVIKMEQLCKYLDAKFGTSFVEEVVYG